MENDLQRAAENFFSTADGRKLSKKKNEIERLSSSRDGEAVKTMLQNGGFEKAMQSGDTDAIKSTLLNVLNTDEGARLMKQFQEMMQGN